MTQAAFETTFARFLGLQEDYGAIRSDIAARFPGDATLQAAMAYGKGIRILKQEPWEALCSFIISQNNNIPRIRKIIEAICARYGDPGGQSICLSLSGTAAFRRRAGSAGPGGAALQDLFHPTPLFQPRRADSPPG